MSRVVSAGRSREFVLASALGTALLTVILAGCPGGLDRGQFPDNTTGAAGTPGAAGMPGMAGTPGTAGMGAVVGCDGAQAIFDAHTCSLVGACHDKDGSAAHFKMAPAGWDAALVGTVPPGGGAGALASQCMASAMPYITKTQPAGGLILAKLKGTTPPCGAKMPSLGAALTADEFTCIQNWANKLASMAP